ncbi:MAG: 6-phosphofructokinase, partial [Planctomycetota bacterium]
VHNATDMIDKLHPTARAHERCFVVEVMGRDAGWIALHSGIAGDADVILIPEIKFNWNEVFRKVKECYANGQNYAIVVCAEAAKAETSGTVILSKNEIGRLRRLGGVGAMIAEEINSHTGIETRVMVCGHVQRGGEPTTFDRLLALRYGTEAIRAIERGETDVMVSFQPPKMITVPLTAAAGKNRRVDLDNDTVQTARALGISFGDRPPTL